MLERGTNPFVVGQAIGLNMCELWLSLVKGRTAEFGRKGLEKERKILILYSELRKRCTSSMRFSYKWEKVYHRWKWSQVDHNWNYHQGDKKVQKKKEKKSVVFKGKNQKL